MFVPIFDWQVGEIKAFKQATELWEGSAEFIVNQPVMRWSTQSNR